MSRFLTIILALSVSVTLQAKINIDKYHTEILEMTVDENIAHPDVPKKLIPEINQHMALLGGKFMALENVKVDLTERSGMVMMITIPASEFFRPNDSILTPASTGLLGEIARTLSVPDRYKLLVTVHSDNTGDDEYLNDLTRVRAEAIVAGIVALGAKSDGIVPYGMGNDEPLNNEQSRAGRVANRRVEFYLIPGPVLIEEIKSK